MFSFIGILSATVFRFGLRRLNKTVDRYIPFAVLSVPLGFCTGETLLGAEKPGLRLMLGV